MMVPDQLSSYCSDLDGLVRTIIQERGYCSTNPNLLFKIGVDGGGGFFKVCLSVSSTESNSNLLRKDTGVKKVFLIGIVPDIPENHANVLKMWHQVQLIGPNACTSMSSKIIATDLKLANILLGLMSHGATHPCTWCDAHKSSLQQKGILRTLGNISDKFWLWFEETDRNRSLAKNYTNVVHFPILKGESTDRVIDLLPPPELHLLIGPVNTLFKAMEKEWTDAMKWPKACHVERDVIHGGSFNGNSCHKLLSHVNVLRSICPLQAVKYVECFQSFAKVVHSCYGNNLDQDFCNYIQDFKKSYLSLGISVTPKVHCVFHHIIDFCSTVNTGLGRYSEQTVEAVHSDFRHTWMKYKVGENHPHYAAHLLKAVCEYNSQHL